MVEILIIYSYFIVQFYPNKPDRWFKVQVALVSVQVPPERQKEEEIRIKRFVARIGYAIAELTGQV